MSNQTPSERCGVTNKPCFATKQDGEAEAKRIRALYGRGRVEWCVFGQHYHVTKSLTGRRSMPRRRFTK